VNPTSDDLLRCAAPILDPVRDALEIGIARRAEALEPLRLGRCEPWLESHLVRSVARSLLEAEAPPNGWPWYVDTTVPNSGIHLSVRGAQLRVAAGDVKRVPSPGRNRARRDYWRQRGEQSFIQLSLLDTDIDAPSQPLNLLLLWRARADGSVAMTLALPYDAWPFGSRPRLLGCVPIADEPIDGEFAADDDAGEDLVAVAEISEEFDEEGM
jgi:hypothetical protein